jgi:uncharacterized membrane protein YgcG
MSRALTGPAVYSPGSFCCPFRKGETMRSVHSLWLALGLALLGSGGSLRAEDCPGVADHANRLSKEGREQLCRRIEEIKKKHGFDLFVMTVAELPEQERKTFPALRFVRRRSFFHTWATELADEAGVNGVFVLICTNPSVVTVITRLPDHPEYFTYGDCEQLRRRFVAVNQEQGLNKALVDLADQLDRMLDAKGPPGKAARPSWLLLLILIGGLLGCWVVLTVVGYVSRRAPRNVPQLDQTPALLGGMFGSVASFPVYDWLLQRPTPPPEASPPSSPEAPTVPSEGTPP